MEEQRIRQLEESLGALPRGAGRIGVDIVEVWEFEGVAPVSLRENFSNDEIAYANDRSHPATSLAGAWAAKEAFFKAVGTGIASGALSPHEVVLRHREDGSPVLDFPDSVALKLGVNPARVAVSIAHDAGRAVAVVALPEGAKVLDNVRPMAKTGGVKNYEKSRTDVMELLQGSPAAEAPPPPIFHTEGELFQALAAKADDPELGPVFDLAKRCGLEFRVVEVHPDAYENLDNAEESNDFRKLAPFAQLHFLAMTVDAESYATIEHAPPLSEGARGAVLVNAGLFDGPEDLADARDLLLRSELLHEAAHFEDPSFKTEGEELVYEWFQEAAGMARQLSRLSQASQELRQRAEALVTDTLEDNPVRPSFDLEMGDGSKRRIASKTFVVLEMELSELHRSFGTLTPDGMNPALFRLLDRFLEDPELFQQEKAALTDKGIEELLKYATKQDKDLRRQVKREMGVQLQELVAPAGAAAKVHEILARTEDLLAGRVEPDFPEPKTAAPALEEVSASEAVPTFTAADPFHTEKKRRAKLFSVTPSRNLSKRVSLLVRSGDDFAKAASHGDIVLNLQYERTSTQALAEARDAALEAAKTWIAGGGKLSLKLSRDISQAQEEIRSFFPELRDGLHDVVAEVETPEDVWALDDELTELEGVLGLKKGSVGLQVVFESPKALDDARRILTCTPRVAAVELGATLPAQLGWFFVPRVGENEQEAQSRRIREAEEALEHGAGSIRSIARPLGVAVLRGPLALGDGSTAPETIWEALREYDGIRLGDCSQAVFLPDEPPKTDLEQRLESFEALVQGGEMTDTDLAFRLEEDLRVLDAAVARKALEGEALERFWRAKWTMLYDEGVPATIEIPDKTLPEVLLESARKHPEKTFCYKAERITHKGEREVLVAEIPFLDILDAGANRVAHILKDLDIQKGDRIALSTSNTLANIAVFQAAASIGAVIVPLDPSKAHLADRFFNDAEAKALFFDAGTGGDDAELHHARLMAWAGEHDLDDDTAFMAELRKARRKLTAEDSPAARDALAAMIPAELRPEFAALWNRKLDPPRKFAEALVKVPSLRAVVLTSVEDFVPGAEPSRAPESEEEFSRSLGDKVKVFRLRDLLPKASTEPVAADVAPDDPIAWPYTGGTTTGVSKAAVHSHKSLLALGLQRGLTMIPESGDGAHVVATTLPFTHTYGFATGVLTPILTGADALVVPNTGPRYLSIVADAMAGEQVSILFSSRSALATLARMIPESANLSNLRRIASSGDTLTPAVTEIWHRRFGVIPCSGYGSTETPSSLMNPARTNRAGTEGIPVPNVEARIVNAVTGEVEPPGVAGLLQVRGPHLSSGYAGRPEASAKVMLDGWWQKDDIFKMDRDGYFVFQGRADDMFTVNELNVYPETVEQALLTLDGVSEVGVIGVFDESIETNRVKAFVVPAAGAELTPESVIEAAKPLLEAHETPTLVEVVGDLAKSNFGKLARAQLRKGEKAKDDTKTANAKPSKPVPPPALQAAETALIFPTGGSHWSGMGADLDLDHDLSSLVDRAEEALGEVGVAKGELRRLMAGENQAKRIQVEGGGWDWAGNFPLSVAAQTVLGIALARRFEEVHGEPVAIVGESMGEPAAYAVAGALTPETAAVAAYRWAAALAGCADEIGLRMAVVENLERDRMAEVTAPLGASVVIEESKTLFVVAIPRENLTKLEEVVGQAGGRALVSNNPCAAHEPRLAQAPGILQEYLDFVESLDIRPTRLPMLSTLDPGQPLDSKEKILDNLKRTFTTPLRWAETIAAVTENGVLNLIQLGSAGSAYVLEKMRGEGVIDPDTRIHSVGTLAGVETLDALPGRAYLGKSVEITGEFIKALATSSGDRNSYHLDEDYAARTRYGSVILHGVGSEGIALAELGRRFPAMEITAVEQPSFKAPVKIGDSVKPILEILDATPQEIKVGLQAVNDWGDILFDATAWVSPRTGSHPEAGEIDLAEFSKDVRPFEPRPAPDFQEGDGETFTFTLDESRIAATRKLFPGGDAAFSATLGIQLLSFASASFVPGYVLTGTSLLDVRRVANELKSGVARAGATEDDVRKALETAQDAESFLDALPLSGKAGRFLKKALPSSIERMLNRLLATPHGKELFRTTWDSVERPLEPGDWMVRTVVEKLEGIEPGRSVAVGMEVTDALGRLLYVGGVTKKETAVGGEAELPSRDDQLASTLVQQKIINVFPVTRPRDAENSAADPDVNAALIDLEDAVSPTMRREARPRAVETFHRVRRDSSLAKKGLIAALQTARSRLKGANITEALMHPEVNDLESLMGKLDFRKKGGEDFLKAMKRPQQKLLKSYLANEGTRRVLADSLGHLDFGGKVLKLRPNNVRTTASAADYFEVVRHVGDRIDALTIPKSRDPREIVEIDRVLTALELANGWPVGHIKLELLIEHPLAVEYVDEIAAASPRIISLIYGHVDYVAATRGWDQNYQFEFQHYAKRRTVEAAHANGQIAIDAITPSISTELAKIDAEKAAAMGFDGKWSIHLEHIAGIRQVQFPPPKLTIKPHSGKAEFSNGVFDLDELGRLASSESPLYGDPLPVSRAIAPDRRAILRVGPERLGDFDPGAASQVQVDARGHSLESVRSAVQSLGDKAAVVLAPDASAEEFKKARELASTLVIESAGGALIDEKALAKAEESFGPQGSIQLGLTQAEELQNAFSLARDHASVTALINQIAPLDDWDVSGALVSAASGLGIDPIQGVDANDEGRTARAFRGAHMGIRGQLVETPQHLEEIRQAYTPRDDLIAEASAVVERYYKAERIENLGAIPYEFTYLLEKPTRGLVDAATAKIFDVVMNRAAELNLLSEEQREIWRSYTLRWRWNDSGEEVDFTRWQWSKESTEEIRRRDDPSITASLGSHAGGFRPEGEDE